MPNVKDVHITERPDNLLISFLFLYVNGDDTIHYIVMIIHLSHKPKPYDNEPQTVISHLFMVIRYK